MNKKPIELVREFDVRLLGAREYDAELSGSIKFQGQSVYELLAYDPVKKRDIYLVRLEYLKNKLIKRLGVLYFIQGLFLWHQGIFTLERIVFPLYFVAFAAVNCGFDRIPFGKVQLRGK